MNIRTSKETKTAARQALSNNWGTAVLVMFISYLLIMAAETIYFIVNFILGFISNASAIIGINTFGSFFYRNVDFFDVTSTIPGIEMALSGFGAATAIVLAIISIIIFILFFLLLLAISANLGVGMSKYFLNLVSSNNAKFSDLFFSFKKCPLKSLWVSLLVAVKTFLWGLLVFIPAGICYGFYTYFLSVNSPAYLRVILLFAAIEFYVLAVIVMLYVSYKYCLAFYVLAKDPTLGVRQTVKLSVQTVKGYKRKRFLLDLSFIGWFLLLIPASVLTCGVGLYIGILFLAPYVYAAQTVQFCDITGIPTVRHDLENTYETYQPYQGFNREQSNTPETEQLQNNEIPVENEDIKDNSGENSTEE